MRIKRATALVCAFEKNTPIIQNFLTRQVFTCNAAALDLLSQLDEWNDLKTFMAAADYEAKSIARTLEELIKKNAIIVEGTREAEQDELYARTWRWGVVAGMYQFSLRDQKFLKGEETREKLRQYTAESPSPSLLASNEGLDVTALPSPQDDPFMATLAARESRRAYSGKPISLQTLASCLHAGNGLKEIEDCGDFGHLPKTMTPSGGARNPYELYVYARNVTGLAPGIYHYSAAEHSLGRIESGELPSPVDLLAHQTWVDKAAAVIFLAATFERTAWKYRQPLAYRVILMECGHITQNILLAATHFGIAAAPTGALAESRIEALLRLRPIEQGVIFAILLGDPANTNNEGLPSEPLSEKSGN